jgi:hypothetical protein
MHLEHSQFFLVIMYLWIQRVYCTCSLGWPGAHDSPASASQNAAIIGMHHHAQLEK